MRTAFGLWLLAATLSLPIFAQDISAPEPHWRDVSATGPQSTAPKTQGADGAQPAASNSKQAPEPKQTEKKPRPDDQESHERVLGLAPMFTVVNDASKARPMTSREKWRLFYRQTYDPFQFVTAAFSAGISQAQDQFPEYGQGAVGYGKRYGAGFADNSLGSFFGNFAYPVLLHDDPRYFRKGSGSVTRRLLYSVGTTVIARHDDGTHHPNYSNVLGNLTGTAFGNLYYPKSDRGVGTTFVRGFEVTAYGAIGGVFQEFWPDIHDLVFKKHKIADSK